MAVVAALIAASGVLVTVVQRARADRREGWWIRFAWVVDHSATDLGGPLTISMLDQLTTTARQLDDPDLVAFAERYTRHVFGEFAEDSPTARHQAHTGPDDEGATR